MCASIEPSVTTAQLFDKQAAGFHVQSVEIGNLKLATRRRLQVAGELNDAVVIEIQAGGRMVRLWLIRFILDARYAWWCPAFRRSIVQRGRRLPRIAAKL